MQTDLSFLLFLAAVLGADMQAGLRIERIQPGPTIAFSLRPSDAEAFKVRAIFVVDEEMNPVWGIMTKELVATPEPPVRTGLQLQGGTHYVFRAGSAEELSAPKLPARVQEWFERAPGIGSAITKVEYGKIPDGFEQVIPEDGRVATLTSGNRYHLFVLGSERGSITFSP